VTFHILIHWNVSLLWFLWSFQTFLFISVELNLQGMQSQALWLHGLCIWIGQPPKTKVLGTELPCPKAIFAVSWQAWSIGPWPMAQAVGFTRPEVAVWCDLGSGDWCLGWNGAAVAAASRFCVYLKMGHSLKTSPSWQF
jgi:hypothetical protein